MTVARTASRTARERARAELTYEIKTEARRQLLIVGAQQLSLRAVARELGMASSAIYRYFPSRDELLTALIIDAYDSLGASSEDADQARARQDLRGRWRATCGAVRNWALANPHEYALIYGSPVPGYQAPQATIAPAGRVALVIGGILADAWAAVQPSQQLAVDPIWLDQDSPDPDSPDPDSPDHPDLPDSADSSTAPTAEFGLLPMSWPDSPPLPPALTAQAALVASLIAPGVPPPVITRALIAWTQLFGMISFELFRQLKGSVDPADEFFGYTVDLMADFVGLPAAPG